MGGGEGGDVEGDGEQRGCGDGGAGASEGEQPTPQRRPPPRGPHLAPQQHRIRLKKISSRPSPSPPMTMATATLAWGGARGLV